MSGKTARTARPTASVATAAASGQARRTDGSEDDQADGEPEQRRAVCVQRRPASCEHDER
jgi:hypothetical protein